MRLFVYSMRTFDELPFFEKFCAKYNVEYDYTTETPCLENLDMAAGYDVVDVITTVFDKPMLKNFMIWGLNVLPPEPSAMTTLMWSMQRNWGLV